MKKNRLKIYILCKLNVGVLCRKYYIVIAEIVFSG